MAFLFNQEYFDAIAMAKRRKEVSHHNLSGRMQSFSVAEVTADGAGLERSAVVARVQRSSTIVLVFISLVLFCAVWVTYTGIRLTLYPSVSDIIERSYSSVSSSEKVGRMASVRKIPFTINSTGTATGLLIFLHGLGDTGHGWSTMFETIRQKHIKYLFPNAESMPVTLNHGMQMPSWFDIMSLDMSGTEDEKGIKKAAESIRALIKNEQEAASIPSNRIILGGFSMGGALALYTGLTHTEQLGGLVLLSSWLPLRNKFLKSEDGLSLTNQRCPIFQGHGDADPMVQTLFGTATHEILSKKRKESWGSDPSAVFKTYRGVGHSSCDEEMRDVSEFVQKQLGSA